MPDFPEDVMPQSLYAGATPDQVVAGTRVEVAWVGCVECGATVGVVVSDLLAAVRHGGTAAVCCETCLPAEGEPVVMQSTLERSAEHLGITIAEARAFAASEGITVVEGM